MTYTYFISWIGNDRGKTFNGRTVLITDIKIVSEKVIAEIEKEIKQKSNANDLRLINIVLLDEQSK